MTSRKRAQRILSLASLLLLSACAHLSSKRLYAPPKAYVANGGSSAAARYAPLLVVQDFAHPYNRIGTPRARKDDDGREHIYIDPARATLYAREIKFKTASREYSNLIYRFHFERVPLPDITAGRNVGLFAIVTLNSKGEPVLLTTVHTCGCYKAFVPTSYLPQKTWPRDWNPQTQEVYGETLPGFLGWPETFSDDCRFVIVLRGETHRVMDVRVENLGEVAWRYDLVNADIQPTEALEALPLDGGTTSFFETSGWRKGFVKGSRKPLEKLLISWWAFDPKVGCDKQYGNHEETGTRFYTSLKFWHRDDSDMWRFADFLSYWGWDL